MVGYMKNSGIANHVVYNLGKNTEEVINDIIKVLKWTSHYIYTLLYAGMKQ